MSSIEEPVTRDVAQVEMDPAELLRADATDRFAQTRYVETPDGAVAAFALLLMPIMPARAGRLTSRLPLWFALMIHVVALVGMLLVPLYYRAVLYSVREGYSFIKLVTENRYAWDNVISYLGLSPEFLYGFIFCVVMGNLVAGFPAAAWCARDEPFKHSYIMGLKRFWLFTPTVLLIYILIATVVGIMLGWMLRGWKFNHEGYRQVYQFIISTTSVLFLTWGVWAMLRFIGSDRTTVGIHRPPMCEGCGYNLTMGQINQNCPECGKPVYESMDLLQRAGTPWERREETGRRRGFMRTVRMAFLSPKELGRLIRVREHTLHHRSFLIPTFCINGLISFIGTLATWMLFMFYYASTGAFGYYNILIGSQFFTLVLSLSCILIAAGFTGCFQSIMSRRNMLAPAMRGACYASVYLWVILILLWLMNALTFGGYHFGLWRSLADASGIHEDMVVAIAWAMAGCALLSVHVVVTSLIASGMRYANR